jgi:hypothetical protein
LWRDDPDYLGKLRAAAERADGDLIRGTGVSVHLTDNSGRVVETICAEPWGRQSAEPREPSVSNEDIADAMRYFGRDPGDLL